MSGFIAVGGGRRELPPLPSRFQWYSSKLAAMKQSARSRRSYGKIGDCEQYIYQFQKPINITYIMALQVCTLSAFSLSSASFIHWSLLISTPFAFKDVTAKEESQKVMLVYCSYQGRGVGGSIQRSLVRGANPLGLRAIWELKISNNDGDGYENVTYKVNSRCLKRYRAYSISFNSSNVGKCFRVAF